MVSNSVVKVSSEECPHCFDDETIEKVIAAQTYFCTSCGASWHELALYGLHYFASGEMHKVTKGGRCEPA